MINMWKRLVCALLVFMLLPIAALCEGRTDEPLYRSAFTMTLNADADAFPQDGAAHYADWEAFLKKLSITGTVDSQRALDMLDSYVRMNAALNVNGKEAIPFTYESYGVSRYISSPAICNDTIFLQMLNFDLFMLKPYFFMELPTNLASMFIFPEQLVWAKDQISAMLHKYFDGKDSISYEKLYKIAEKISSKIQNDAFQRYYYILYGFLAQIYGIDMAYDDLCCLPDWIDALDPEQQGLTVTQDSGDTVYTIGSTEVLRTNSEGWTFTAHDSYEYDHTIAYRDINGDVTVSLLSVLDGDERLNASFSITGLPKNGELSGSGVISVQITGGAFSETLSIDEIAVKLNWRYDQSAAGYPRQETLALGLVNPATDKECITFTWKADVQEVSGSEVINQRESYEELPDFFTLNTVTLTEFKQKYFKSIALSAIPVALEMPIGVIGDAVEWFSDSGFMAFFGIE